jgi:D-amino-acid dehydrogenase
MADAIVIGGGIVGASAAYNLAKDGAQTLLIDRADYGRATDAGAGILSPETSGLMLPRSWFDYAITAVGYYSTLISALNAEQDGDTGYAVCGDLVVAVSDDEIEPFEQAKRIIFERQQRRGLPSLDDLYEVTPAEAREFFPPLADVKGAIYFRNAARVDGRLLTAAMLRAAQKFGLDVNHGSVDQLLIENGVVTGVAVGAERYFAEKVIIAGGAWAQHFGAQLGVNIPVRPMRGQIIHLDLPDTDTGKWCIISPFHGHYMLAWDDSRVVIGATREPDSGFEPHTTIVGMREVIDEGLRVAPGLANAQFREVRVGLRPATADNLPVLGEIPGVENLYLATGMGASGLQLGPYSGKLASDWAQGKQSQTDISAFSITRFES